MASAINDLASNPDGLTPPQKAMKSAMLALMGMLDSVPESVSWTLTHSASGAEVQVGDQSFTVPTPWAVAAGLAIYDDEVVFEDVVVTP